MAGPMTLEEFDRQLSSRLGGGVADPSLPPIPSLTGREPGQEFGPELADPSVSPEDVFVKAQQRVRDTQAPPSAAITSSATGQGSGQSEQEMMDILIKARGRLSGERGQVRGFGTPLDAIRYLARSGVNLAGFLATPIIDPITRSGMTEEQKAEDAQLPVGQRLANAVGRSQEAATGLLQYIGITPENTPAESETIMARVGEDLIPAALAALAITRGAPYVGRMSGYAGRVPLVARIGRAGEAIAQRPVTTATAIVGTQPSGTITRELASPVGQGLEEAFGGPNSWLGSGSRFLWDLTTETIGGGLTAGLVRRTTAPLMPSAERFSPFATPTAPIIDRATDPVTAAAVMRVQAATHVDAIDRMMATVIDDVNRTGLNPVDAGEVFRGGLIAVRDFAKDQSDAAYAALPSWLNVSTPSRLLEGVEQQLGRLQRFVAESDNFDGGYLNDILNQLTRRGPGGRPVIDPLTGRRVFRDIVSFDELQNIRTRLDILSRAAAETNVKGVQGNRILKANLDDLHARLTDDIDTGLTNLSPAYAAQWELAREMYRVYNQRFMQGPVGELLMTTRHHPVARAGTAQPPGSMVVPDAQVTAKLLKPDATADAVWEAVQPFFGNGLDPALGAARQATAGTRAEDAVRSMFEHELRTVWKAGQETSRLPQGAQGIPGLTYKLSEQPGGAVVGKAERFIQEHEPLLRQWTRLTTDMIATQERLSNLLHQRNEYTQSLVYQFLGSPPGKVIETAMTSPNRDQLFRQLYNQFSANPQALEGMRRALIDFVFSGHGVDPTEAISRLRSPEIESVMRIMFTGAHDRLARLYDTTQAAANILGDVVRSTASGQARIDPEGVRAAAGPIRRGIRSATENFAGWFLGLMPGHYLVRALNLGSQGALSVPARFSSHMRAITAAAWMRNHVRALDAMRDAAFDPRFEAWMMNSVDTGWRAQLANYKSAVRLTNVLQRSMNEDVEEYLNNNARRKAREDRARVELEWRRAQANPFKE